MPHNTAGEARDIQNELRATDGTGSFETSVTDSLRHKLGHLYVE